MFVGRLLQEVISTPAAQIVQVLSARLEPARLDEAFDQRSPLERYQQFGAGEIMQSAEFLLDRQLVEIIIGEWRVAGDQYLRIDH